MYIIIRCKHRDYLNLNLSTFYELEIFNFFGVAFYITIILPLKREAQSKTNQIRVPFHEGPHNFTTSA
jgi:hypothetical protein